MNDMEWEVSLLGETCHERRKLGRFKIGQTLPKDGSWTEWKSKTINMKKRTQVWYFMLADCNSVFYNRGAMMPWMEIEIRALNDGSHLSQENWWILEISVFMLLSFLVLMS